MTAAAPATGPTTHWREVGKGVAKAAWPATITCLQPEDVRIVNGGEGVTLYWYDFWGAKLLYVDVDPTVASVPSELKWWMLAWKPLMPGVFWAQVGPP
jgi:hypothetical protein